MSQRCPNCEVEAPNGANFCSNCGHTVSQEVGREVHQQQRGTFLSNLQQPNSTPSLTATSGGRGSHTVLEMWSGLAAMLAGILITAVIVLMVLEVEDFSYLYEPGLALGILLVAIALPGLQSRQAGLLGRAGRVGGILATIGVVSFTMLFPFSDMLETFFRSVRATGIGWLTIGAAGVSLNGLILFGMATASVNVFPRWAAVMVAAGVPLGIPTVALILYFVSQTANILLWSISGGLVIFAVGLMRLGYGLWAHAHVKQRLSKRLLPEVSNRSTLWSRVPPTGFGDKTIWDWLQLLIVPIVLALASYWFTIQQDVRQYAIEEQRSQDATLQAYLDKIGELILEEHLRNSEEDSQVRTLARSRTLSLLERLDPSRKARVMLFLAEANLVQSVDGNDPIIRLSGADLSDSPLNNADLSGAELGNADLSGADLSNADLSGADLSNAALSGADLSKSDINPSQIP
jgi:hypothetical protein